MDDKKTINNQSVSSATTTPRENLTKFTEILAEFNSIRENLAKLPLNPEEKEYVDTYIQPLTVVLYELTTASSTLTNSTSNLAKSFVTSAKDSKLEDTEKLVYDINKTCIKLFNVIKKRLDVIT